MAATVTIGSKAVGKTTVASKTTVTAVFWAARASAEPTVAVRKSVCWEGSGSRSGSGSISGSGSA